MTTTAWRWLSIASVIETASLPLLLLNRATAHWPAVTSTLGPLHGFAYLTVIALALAATCPPRQTALALIPAIGGLLFMNRYRRATLHGDNAAPIANKPSDPAP